MTEPHDPEAHEQPIAPLDDDAVARLRALLRDEPVEDDEVSRARRIRTALDAMPASTSPVPVPRHRAGRPWLVAAAVVAVLGLGGLLAAQVATSGGGEDQASEEMADSATTSTTAGPAAAESGAAAGSGAAADRSTGGIASTTAPSPTASLIPTPDLGAFADVAALRAALATAGERGGEAPTPSWPDGLLRCVQEQRARGAEVAGVATVGGSMRVVVRVPAGIELVDPLTCAPV